ncbi:MAG: ribbon-helix-helix domain-containing protein [Acidobacteriota bacterium]|jgi:predicted DNA-binding protein
MRTLSIRIPDELDELLERESKRVHRKRSELVREAVGRYLEDLERRRFMDRMVRAADALRGDPEVGAVAEEFEVAEAEALRLAETGALEVAEPEPPPYVEADDPKPGDAS